MNNIIKNIKKSVLLLSAILLLYSCKKEYAVAPPIMFEGKETWTIRELLDYGITSNLPDSIITGIVVSSDEKGNFYKSIVIQDKTAGIQIKVDNSALYNRYRIGQQVFVKCKDLVLGKYYNLPQIGIGDSLNVVAIPSKFEFQHIFRHNIPQAAPAPYVITATTTEAELKEHLNMFVAIPNCQFLQKGVPFVDPANTRPYTSRDINLKIGSNNLTVNTSKYVDDEIGKALTPDGTGTVRGILTIYQGSGSPVYQIVLRSIKDIDFVWTEKVYDLNDHISESQFGWSYVNSGAAWSSVTSQQQAVFQITGTGSASDSWLISPALNLSAYNSADLNFERFLMSGNNVQLYYTTTAYTPGSPIVSSNWTQINLSEYESTNWDAETVAIPTTAKAIAYRYTGSNSTAYIRKIVINAKKSN